MQLIIFTHGDARFCGTNYTYCDFYAVNDLKKRKNKIKTSLIKQDYILKSIQPVPNENHLHCYVS